MDKQRYNQTSDRVYIVSELTNHIIDNSLKWQIINATLN